MGLNYEISKEAQFDLDKAICYFKLIGREDNFSEDFISNLRVIRDMPKAFQIRYKNVRIVIMDHFNYSIHYSIYNDSIFILRVLNQKQDF